MRKLLVIFTLLFAGSASAVPITDPHDIDGDNEVGYTHFVVDGAGLFDILARSRNIDPYLFLFRDDGDLTNNDFIAQNDDSNGTLNSRITRQLGLGNYIAAVSNYRFTRNEAVNGYNNFTTPGRINVTVQANRYDRGNASARLAVPEPTSIALLGMGLVAVGFVRRRKNMKNS